MLLYLGASTTLTDTCTITYNMDASNNIITLYL